LWERATQAVSIAAVRIAAVIVDPARFQDKGHFWSYCGLVKHHKMSGGRSYGKRSLRCSRTLKNVFKTAALAVIGSGSLNSLRNYYDSLVSRGMVPWDARNKVPPGIFIIVYSLAGSVSPYLNPRRRCFLIGSRRPFQAVSQL